MSHWCPKFSRLASAISSSGAGKDVFWGRIDGKQTERWRQGKRHAEAKTSEEKYGHEHILTPPGCTNIESPLMTFGGRSKGRERKHREWGCLGSVYKSCVCELHSLVVKCMQVRVSIETCWHICITQCVCVCVCVPLCAQGFPLEQNAHCQQPEPS